MDAAARSRIADPSLAPEGEQRIQWVAKHSPVLNRLARERLADGALTGKRVAVVVHLEAKTAYLATLLAGCGRRGRCLRLQPRLDAGRDLRRARRPRDRGARHARCLARAIRRRSARRRRHAARDRRRRRGRVDGAHRRAPAGDRSRAPRRDRGDDDRRRAAAGDGGSGQAELSRRSRRTTPSASTSSTTATAPGSRRSPRSTGSRISPSPGASSASSATAGSGRASPAQPTARAGV